MPTGEAGMTAPRLRFTTTTLSTRDPRALASFYERLLGWERAIDEDGWVLLRESEAAGHRLAFHIDEAYQPPVWPSRAGEQTMMAHLEIATNDVEGAVAHAIACGATPADDQPQHDVRVMLDPDGHPFCLFHWADA
jgi:catechol 2,3-dioxygenase-like lactoylglutathione lyase family enzyme